MTGTYRLGARRARIVMSAVLAMAALGATATEAVAAPARSAPHRIGAPRDFDRQLVEDLAEFGDEEEVRLAAKAALESEDPNAIREFLDHGMAEARKRAQEKKKDTDAENRKKIEAMRGTGGPHFNAEVERVLGPKATANDRASFLSYGADLAREQDAKEEKDAKDHAATLRKRVEMLATVGGPEVKKAARAALDAGNDAAITAFLDKGYLVAAQKDADNQAAREKELKEAQEKLDKELELARKTAAAAPVRTKLLDAHADALKALTYVTDDLAISVHDAREAGRLIENNRSEERLYAYDQARADVIRRMESSAFFARATRIHATQVKIHADFLTENGLPQDTRWAEVADGLAAVADATVKAYETARSAANATADAASLKAKNTPKAYEQQDAQWRAYVDRYTEAAAALTAAAQKQAKVLADASAGAQAKAGQGS
ncbi:hypothetical protein [Streptomyces rimosus]|uniref:hypothetical protein n=1 Tax=Streptomyces rimosus TaxID=1927 RepID=UPI00378DB6FE